MTDYQFRTLLIEVSRALGHEDLHRLADLREAPIDGVPTRLLFDAVGAPQRLVLHFDLGPIPEPQVPVALERLLRLNLLSGSKTTGVYALEPFGWQATYAVHFFDLEQRSPVALAAALREHAASAQAAQQLMLAPAA